MKAERASATIWIPASVVPTLRKSRSVGQPQLGGVGLVQQLLRHDKLWIAVESSTWRHDRNRAGSRACRNRRLDIAIGLNREVRLHAVECDAGRSGQVVAKDDDAFPDFSGRGHGLHKWAQPVRESEDRASATWIAVVQRASVKIAIGALQEHSGWVIGAVATREIVERSERALRRKLKDQSAAGLWPQHIVEIAIAGQRERVKRVTQVSIAETMQNLVAIVRSNPERGPAELGTTNGGDAEQSRMRALGHGQRLCAVDTVRNRTEVVENRIGSGGRELVGDALGLGPGPSELRDSVKVSIVAQNWRRRRLLAIRAICL